MTKTTLLTDDFFVSYINCQECRIHKFCKYNKNKSYYLEYKFTIVFRIEANYFQTATISYLFENIRTMLI
jgi:hypothetical protein